MTKKELLAFNYISWPIWRTKRPFLRVKFETDELLDPETSDKQSSDEQDESENSIKPDTTEPVLEKPVHVDEPSKAGVHDVIEPGPSEQLEKETMQEILKLQPSTSVARLEKLTKAFCDLSKLENVQRHQK